MSCEDNIKMDFAELVFGHCMYIKQLRNVPVVGPS
jgi:hypothetical protein